MARSTTLCIAIGSTVVASAQDLLRGEYFFEVDPGSGNGTNINFPSTDEIDLELPVDVSTLPPSGHVPGIRMKDADGHWSLTNRRPFMVRQQAPGGNSTAIEYFLDGDPGFGNGTMLPTSGAPVIQNMPFVVITDAMSAGAHTMFTRAWSEHGAVSITSALPFEVFVGIDELAHLGITTGLAQGTTTTR